MKFTSLIISIATLSTSVMASEQSIEQNNSIANNEQPVVVAITERVVQTNRHLSMEARQIPAVLSDARVVITNRHLSEADRKIPATFVAKKESKTNRHFR